MSSALDTHPVTENEWWVYFHHTARRLTPLGLELVPKRKKCMKTESEVRQTQSLKLGTIVFKMAHGRHESWVFFSQRQHL